MEGLYQVAHQMPSKLGGAGTGAGAAEAEHAARSAATPVRLARKPILPPRAAIVWNNFRRKAAPIKSHARGVCLIAREIVCAGGAAKRGPAAGAPVLDQARIFQEGLKCGGLAHRRIGRVPEPGG